jgi:Tol biopolymer transport system component
MIVLGLALLSAASAPSAPSSSSGLYVVSATGGKPRKVVDACVESFAWSPDGRAIAYVRLVTDNEPAAVTEVIDLRTGRTKRLADDGRAESPSWSPDGTHVAFDTNAGILVGLRAGPTKARIVASGDGVWPAWSPDGKRIAVNSLSQHISFVTPAGVRLKTLKRTKTGLDVPVLWFPDGQRLLYSTNGSGLASVSTGGTTIRTVVSSGVGRGFAISPEGKRIAFETDSGVSIVSANGGPARRLPSVGLGGWAPDGHRLVVVGTGVFVVNDDGSGMKKVAPRAGADGFAIGQPVASWSSRGEIAYMDTDPTCGGPD